MKYQNRITLRTVDALQFAGGNFAAVRAFVDGGAEWRAGKLVVATRHGALWVDPQDWIVRHGDGAYTAVSDKEFKATHSLSS